MRDTLLILVTGVYWSEEKKERLPRLPLDAVSEDRPAPAWLTHASLALPSLLFLLPFLKTHHRCGWCCAAISLSGGWHRELYSKPVAALAIDVACVSDVYDVCTVDSAAAALGDGLWRLALREPQMRVVQPDLSRAKLLYASPHSIT